MYINAEDLKLYKTVINAENGDYEEVYKLKNSNKEEYYLLLEIFSGRKNTMWNCEKYNSWQDTLDSVNSFFNIRKNNNDLILKITPYIVVNR